jgi:hypothetical protein
MAGPAVAAGIPGKDRKTCEAQGARELVESAGMFVPTMEEDQGAGRRVFGRRFRRGFGQPGSVEKLGAVPSGKKLLDHAVRSSDDKRDRPGGLSHIIQTQGSLRDEDSLSNFFFERQYPADFCA